MNFWAQFLSFSLSHTLPRIHPTPPPVSTHRNCNRRSKFPNMETGPSNKDRYSSAEAVMLGALAPGVNGATWNTLKIAFLMLGVCLAAMLGLAFSFSDSSLIFHVTFLVLIAATLFVLLSGFLAETGLVSVEHQLQEMGLETKNAGDSNTKSN